MNIFKSLDEFYVDVIGHYCSRFESNMLWRSFKTRVAGVVMTVSGKIKSRRIRGLNSKEANACNPTTVKAEFDELIAVGKQEGIVDSDEVITSPEFFLGNK